MSEFKFDSNRVRNYAARRAIDLTKELSLLLAAINEQCVEIIAHDGDERDYDDFQQHAEQISYKHDAVKSAVSELHEQITVIAVASGLKV